jgi:hypothetical protein
VKTEGDREGKPKTKTARPERPSRARPDLYDRKWLLQTLELGMDADRIAVMTGQPIQEVRREIRQARDPEAPLTDRIIQPTEATP